MPGFISWLVTPADQSGPNGGPLQFALYVPWIIFCALGLIIPIYYYLEGRKRFVGHHALNKYILDRMLYRHLLPVALVGWMIMGMFYAMDYNLFSWRIWRYMWVLWIAGLAVYWIYYFAFRYAGDLEWYRNKRTMEKYYPQPRAKRRQVKATAR